MQESALLASIANDELMLKELNKLIPQLYNTKTFYLKYKFDRLEPYMSNHIVKIGWIAGSLNKYAR